jgi:hypothetical protein
MDIAEQQRPSENPKETTPRDPRCQDALESRRTVYEISPEIRAYLVTVGILQSTEGGPFSREDLVQCVEELFFNRPNVFQQVETQRMETAIALCQVAGLSGILTDRGDRLRAQPSFGAHYFYEAAGALEKLRELGAESLAEGDLYRGIFYYERAGTPPPTEALRECAEVCFGRERSCREKERDLDQRESRDRWAERRYRLLDAANRYWRVGIDTLERLRDIWGLGVQCFMKDSWRYHGGGFTEYAGKAIRNAALPREQVAQVIESMLELRNRRRESNGEEIAFRIHQALGDISGLRVLLEYLKKENPWMFRPEFQECSDSLLNRILREIRFLEARQRSSNG